MRKTSLFTSIFLVGILFFTGCATTQRDWEKAAQQNNISAYQLFIKTHSDSEYVKQADDRIEQIRYEKAKTSQSENELKAFLKQYPATSHTAEINELIMQVALRNSVSESMCSDFLSRFPNSNLSPQVATKLREIRYKAARSAKTATSYEKFINEYPDGPDSMDLQEELPMIRKWGKSKQLGELLIDMAPKTNLNITDRDAFLSSVPASESDEKLAKFRKLLEDGADPNAVRIAGYTPGGQKKLSKGGHYNNAYIRPDGTLLLAGNPGMVVPASDGSGLTLLQYCEANGLNRASRLLKK
jgi:hypothetical protein